MAEFHQGAREQSQHRQRRQTKALSLSLGLFSVRFPLEEDATSQGPAEQDLIAAAFILTIEVVILAIPASHCGAVCLLGRHLCFHLPGIGAWHEEPQLNFIVHLGDGEK